MRRRPTLRLLLVGGVFAVAAAVYLSPFWLPGIALFLVVDEPPVKADIAVVLAGDWTGERIRKAARLAEAGFVPKVMISGPDSLFGRSWCPIFLSYAVGLGYPAEWFTCVDHPGRATRTEADAILAALEKHGVRSFLLVTSDTHTRRARRLYAAATRIPFRTIAARSEEFPIEQWWKFREGRKAVFLEWVKTITEPLGF